MMGSSLGVSMTVTFVDPSLSSFTSFASWFDIEFILKGVWVQHL